MENPDALAAYIAQISGEREDYLRQRTARQADAGADRMSRDGRGEWIRSEDFSRRLWQEMRRDKVWQTLRRGELIQDFHKAEFERLRPLIESELRHGHAVDLPFLRSVSRGRLTRPARTPR